MNANVKGKVKAWEQIKKDYPNVTLNQMSEFSKQQIVNHKPDGFFYCAGFLFRVYADGTYQKVEAPETINLKISQ